MIRRFANNERGITLIELLITIAIFSLISILAFNVLTTSLKQKNKVEDHIDVRQEANLILAKWRQIHEEESSTTYGFCYNSDTGLITINSQLLASEGYHFEDISIKYSNDISPNYCEAFSKQPLFVEFTLVGSNGDQFEVDTIIGREIKVTENNEGSTDFFDYLVEHKVFIYGNSLSFTGPLIEGPSSTMVIKGDFLSEQLNGGASINVQNIYIDGHTTINSSSDDSYFGTNAGKTIVNGNLTLLNGKRNMYGDIYVNGDFYLKDAKIYKNVYVNGNVEIDWTPTLSSEAIVYYTGTLKYPKELNNNIVSKFIKKSSIATESFPEYPIPSLKPDKWFEDNGYVSGGTITNNKKIFSNDYRSDSWVASASNVIIVSKGNINLSNIGSLSGVLFAPNGEVNFSGASFEGLIIARDGFHVTGGWPKVTFKNIEHYISNPDKIPFN
ncbi:hypothetical protein UACE39S_05326 [Ureibacillus acetophenoni]